MSLISPSKFNIFILVVLISCILNQNEICNYYNDCSSCTFCGEDKNYTECDFINLFCESGTNTFTSKYGTYKNNYLNYFKKEKDAEIFCGDQKSALKENQKETLIIQTGRSYAQGTRIHCHYNVIYNDYYNSYKKYNPLMTYELIGGGENKLKFNLIVIYYGENDIHTDIFTDGELRNNPYYDNVTDYDKVELLIDFKENEYSHIDETFTVKVKLELKEGEMENSDSGSSTGTVIGEIFGGIAGLILIGGIIYCLCGQEKTYEVKEKSSCSIF